MREIKSVLSSTPVYQQSSFIENFWLWTDIKCLCDEFVKNLKTLTIFTKKSSIKNSCGYKTAVAYQFSFIATGWSCDTCSITTSFLT